MSAYSNLPVAALTYAIEPYFGTSIWSLLYTEDGKFGWYTKILDVCHLRKRREGEEELDVFEGAGNSEGLRQGSPTCEGVKLLFDLKLLLVLYRYFFEFSCACTGLTSHLNEPRIEP